MNNFMSTRGVYGFRIEDMDKLAFAPADAYPEVLGRKVLEYIASHDREFIFRQAKDLRLLKCPDLEGNSRFNMEETFASEIIDAENYIINPDCEWAWIINLDSRQLEVHSGSILANYRPKGRYILSSNPPYYKGAILIDEIPLDIIRPENIDHFVKAIETSREKLFLTSRLIESSLEITNLRRKLEEATLPNRIRNLFKRK